MKKQHFLSLILVLAMTLTLCACGGPGKPATTEPDQSAESSASVESLTISGKVDEVKDFMFVIDAEDGCFYAFDTASLPEGAALPKVGDMVLITYEGELSEVDNFTGTILSIEVVGGEQGEQTEDTSSTVSPIQQTDNGYVYAADIGTECSFDLDGDGTEETIFYDVAPYLETETQPAALTVNGVDFLSDNEDNPMEDYSFWIENPSNEKYFVVDLDAADGMLELAVTDWGSNDWLLTHLFRYQGGELTYLGYIPAFPDSEDTVYFGDSTVGVMDHLDIMQTWSGFRTYVYQDGKIAPLPGEMIQPLQHSQEVFLREELTVYAEPDQSSEKKVLQPSDQPVQFPVTDNDHWVQIQCSDGTEGWIYFTELYHMENGEAVVDADTVFEGLVYAG